MRLIARLARWRYAVAAAAYLLFALLGDQDNGDLEFFTQALHILGHGGVHGGLHLYAVSPNIQIGPLAILGTGLLDLLCAGKIVFAIVLGSLILLMVLLHTLDGLARDEGYDDTQRGIVMLVGGVVLAAAWAVAVPGWGHIDDLAALTAMVLALRAARSGRAVWAGALLAVALGCKPWGGYAFGLLFLLPAGRRRPGFIAFFFGAVLCWGPFVAAAPHTVSALAHFAIQTNYASLPMQLGYAVAPSWVRPAQLAVSTLLLLACWRYRRWDLALLVVGISRLALDAGTYAYYDVELVLGCLVTDVVAAGRSRRLLAAGAPLSLLAWMVTELLHAANLSSTDAFAVRSTLYLTVLMLAVVRGLGPPERRPARAPEQVGLFPAARQAASTVPFADSILALQPPRPIGTMARPQRP